MSGGISGIGQGLDLRMLEGAAGAGGAGASETKATGGFADLLKGKLVELNDSQALANTLTNDVATGEVDDIAQTMMQIEQSNVSLQMATQVRNKVIEAYQEILRMQI